MGGITHTQELQIHTNTPQVSSVDRKKTNRKKTNKRTESSRGACKPFSKACVIPTPIVARQSLFAPELLTLSAPLIQKSHQLFTPTDNPIMRASKASKTTTTTTIITIFCWEQPSTNSTIRTILSGKQQEVHYSCVQQLYNLPLEVV